MYCDEDWETYIEKQERFGDEEEQQEKKCCNWIGCDC